MRIHNVVITGFGPFRDTEQIDFDAFDNDGIFLITGRTGAGKTSILDAVSFAMFGSVPRYGGGVDDNVRSNFLQQDQPCRVSVEFTIGEIRYRATRSTGYVRQKKSGTGTTTEKATASLEQLCADGWEVLETRISDTSDRIAEIVRLNAGQFRQVVLLAQGQFQEFLVANSNQRRDLLRTLFGTERFTRYADLLKSRADDLARQLGEQQVTLRERVSDLGRETEADDAPRPEPGNELSDWVERVVAEQFELVAQATAEETRLTEVRNAATSRYEEARAQAERQHRRDEALARQAELASEDELIESLRQRLAVSRRADLAKSAVEGWTSAADALSKEGHKHAIAEANYLAAWPDHPTDPLQVSDDVESLTRLIGRLEEQLPAEESFAETEAAVDAARRGLEAHDERHQRIQAERDLSRERIASLTQDLEDLQEKGAGLPLAQHRERELADKLDAARRADKVAAQLEEALRARQAAGESLTAISAERDELRRAQLSGYAGVLAQDLEPGAACPVCGSAEHPRPAALPPGSVGEAEVTAADERVNRTFELSKQAGELVSRLTAELGAERQRAGELTVEALELALAAAKAEVADLKAMVEEAEAMQGRCEELEVCVDEHGTALDRSVADRVGLAAAVTAAETHRDTVAAALVVARGDHPSVADRLDDARSRCTVGQRLLTATAALSTAAAQETSQRRRLDTVLVETGFADVEAVGEAALPVGEQGVVEQRITGHVADVKAVALVLAAPDLQELPEDPVDVAGPQADKEAADAALLEAQEIRVVAGPKLKRMQNLAEAIGHATKTLLRVQEQHSVAHRLASSVRGQEPNTMKMQLEAFVLAAELEEIVGAANGRLKVMTSGRYELLHSDALASYAGQSGLALKVLDAHTGEARSPESLSGGEKFQASLALALGLAEVVTGRAGGMRLDTLFIDEGFGSLDSDTLDTTMATLDSLRDGGRTVGLISHVESLRETIPAQLKVKVAPGGWSVIDHGAAPTVLVEG